MTEGLFARVRVGLPAPDTVFLESEQGRILTYGEMERLSARFAATLVALGVTKGDRVAAQTEKSPEALILYIACLRAGAVYLPLNTAYTPSEIAYFLGDAEPRVFVCDPAKAEALAPVAETAGVEIVLTMGADGEGSFADRAAGQDETFEDVAVAGDDLAAILYTSGTTGRSKGAMLSHDNLLSNAETLRQYWGFTGQDVLLHALPIFHTHGLFVASNVVLLSGASVLFLPRFDIEAMMRLLPRATTMIGVPTFYARLLGQKAFDRALVQHMRLFISGSAPLSAETHREFSERTGHAILERYGMTETNMNTSNPLDGERIPGTVGFPLPGVELRVADPDTGAVLPEGEIGVLEVKGPNVFKGYWRNPEKTAEEFRADGFFITGDLGRIDERGYVSIVGRGKDLVISGGFNVYPAEVETEIDSLPGVAESAVIGVPHADFGEGVTAVVAARPDATLDEAQIQTALAGKLAKYKVPKRVIVVDSLPRNTMGKVQKNVLRETYKDLFA